MQRPRDTDQDLREIGEEPSHQKGMRADHGSAGYVDFCDSSDLAWACDLRDGPDGSGSSRTLPLLFVEVIVHVDDVGLEILLKAVLAVGAADAGLAPSGMEALHGLEVFAIHVGFAELQLI